MLDSISPLIAQYFPNGWLHYVVGGGCIGLGVSLLFALTGRIGGMSTVYSSTWGYWINRPFFRQAKFIESRQWRLFYALGLVIGAFLSSLLVKKNIDPISIGLLPLFLGGLIAGFGARMSGGCTSGHGICGMASLNLASIVAVLIFMVTAILTANLTKAWIS